jgi:hypothetical protein
VKNSVKTFLWTRIKCAAVSTLILFVFVSPAIAVLRPPFPAKPAAPFDDELVIIGDDFVPEFAKTPAALPETHTVVARTVHYGLCPKGYPSIGKPFANIWQ